MSKWLLPDHIEDLTIGEAEKIEGVKRQAIDYMRRNGYSLISPPLIEHLDALISGAGDDLELSTFKLVDQLSGKTLGIRPDMTIQAARMDASIFRQPGICRLCYYGSVLHTRPKGVFSSREPIQIGAEMFGFGAVEGDIEVQKLMLDVVFRLGISCDTINLVLGHQGIIKALINACGAEMEAKSLKELYTALKHRDRPEIKRICSRFDKNIKMALVDLPTLTGESNAILAAKKILPKVSTIEQAILTLEMVEKRLKKLVGGAVTLDFVDLRGFEYHTGLVFSMYAVGENDAIGWGGRYDDLGRSFGRARPATGFTMDLRALSKICPGLNKEQKVLAPYLPEDTVLDETIDELRSSGFIVEIEYPGMPVSENSQLTDFQYLVKKNGSWTISRDEKGKRP